MALVKCPRCELNYILDGGTLCTVCRREVRGEHEIIDTPEMCSECGENPAVPGSDLCMFCIKEMNRRMSSSMDDGIVQEDANIGIDKRYVEWLNKFTKNYDGSDYYDYEEFNQSWSGWEEYSSN